MASATMNIPDGEYDIDLSVLDSLDSPETSALALRYGFIPDSMDQTQPLSFIHSDNVCLLEAQSVEKSRANGRGLPIIFEGTPQRQRPASKAQALPTDSYFLAFSPAPNASGDVKVALKRLGNTIRVSKSRNADKWRASISEWRKNPASLDNEGVPSKATPNLHKPSVEPAKPAKAEPKPAPKPAPRAAPAKPSEPHTSSAQAPKTIPRTVAARPRASKRPPKPESGNDIISVSDFENLESDEDSNFPVFDTQSREQSQPKPAPTPKAVAKKKPEDTASDDFADLENQLHEVLDNGANSSSDSDTDVFSGGPIIIDGIEEKSRKSYVGTVSPNRKPMGLRELYGGGKNDYLSSSEEE